MKKIINKFKTYLKLVGINTVPNIILVSIDITSWHLIPFKHAFGFNWLCFDVEIS